MTEHEDDCPMQNCPHHGTIAKLEQYDDHIIEFIREIRDDVRELKTAVSSIQVIQNEHLHIKDAIARSFARIEVLERERAHDKDVDNLIQRVKEIERACENYDDFIAQVRGMKSLAWALWTILASGMGAILFKLFVISNGVA